LSFLDYILNIPPQRQAGSRMVYALPYNKAARQQPSALQGAPFTADRA